MQISVIFLKVIKLDVKKNIQQMTFIDKVIKTFKILIEFNISDNKNYVKNCLILP